MIPFTLEHRDREVLGLMQQESIAPALYRYFSVFCKTFVCKWKSSEKEMEEELTLPRSIEVQKWQDEEERKQKYHSCKETTKGSILQGRVFAEDVECSC